MPLTLEIVTPEARVYSATVESVVIPTTTGEVGILPGHIPLLTQVEHGELRVTKDGATQWLAVSGGFAQVEGDRVAALDPQHADLLARDVDFLTLGQYLQPTLDSLPVERYVPPEEFDDLGAVARRMGFRKVASGPGSSVLHVFHQV